MNIRRVGALLAARNREFLRDHTSLTWNLLFPVLLVAGLAIVFSGKPPAMYQVGLYGDGPAAAEFMDTEYVRFVPEASLEAAIRKVARHQLDLLIDRPTGRYWVNDSSPKGYILERVLQGSVGRPLQRLTVTDEAVRYVDWVLPGVLGMNIMFSSLFGVGYVVVRYRKNGVLKRLKATPLTPLEFLLAQVLSRLGLNLGALALVLIVLNLLIDFRMLGSYLNLLLVFVLGALSLISLGVIVSTRTASEELAGGLSNLLSWPMVLLSGVWFSLEGAPWWVQQAAQLLPLTHIVAAARAVMVDGAGLTDIAGSLLVLAGMATVFLLLGAILFRWE